MVVKMCRLLDDGVSKAAIARRLKVSRSSVYRILEREGKHARTICQRADDVHLLRNRHRQIITDAFSELRLVTIREQINGCFEAEELGHLAREIALLRTEHGEIFHDRTGKYGGYSSDIGNMSTYRRKLRGECRYSVDHDATSSWFDLALH